MNDFAARDSFGGARIYPLPRLGPPAHLGISDRAGALFTSSIECAETIQMTQVVLAKLTDRDS